MPRGTIVDWRPDRGTGFISDEADKVRVFFGDRVLRGLRPEDIKVGMAVEFERDQGERGPRARNVRRLGAAVVAPPPASPPAKVSKLTPSGSGVEVPHEVPLPRSLQKLLKQVALAERHSGLQLDKYLVPCLDQQAQKQALAEVVQTRGGRSLLPQLVKRRQLLAVGACAAWTRTTSGPLTLHLARASALENAGLCLHPIYGFAYLPASGLKGMARAYAETVARVPFQEVESVFGTQEKDREQAGSIVFHDGWPTSWPELLVDICNNHHDGYYQKTPPEAPGDWHSPNPVYFLAVAPKQSFSFLLTKRRDDVADATLARARDWLDGALTLLGCGAKTAAGYGAFAGPTPTVATRATFTATLELVTPAFLAGASQDAADCTLRSATLRGLLRWWWRTLHVGFVDVPTLRAMEAAIWGDTSAGGAVLLLVEPASGVQPAQLDRAAVIKDHRLPRPTNPKTSQGLTYHSYGMADGARKPPASRWYAPEGSRWTVRVLVRPGAFVVRDAAKKELVRTELSAEAILDQVKSALWWFCRLGGVGSKSRKGFGSFADPLELADFEGGLWKTKGKQFRAACQLPETTFNPAWAESPNLFQLTELGRSLFAPISWLETAAGATDVWVVLDRLGTAAQSFAQAAASTGHGKHCPQKLGLGLPRSIDKAPARKLRGAKGDRHASPVLYHVGRHQGGLVIRVCAFPSRHLREATQSPEQGLEQQQRLLRQVLETLQAQLAQ